MQRVLYALPFLSLAACASTADLARQSWQESRQICSRLAEPSERNLCNDMAWEDYRYVLRSSLNAQRELGADREARDAQEKKLQELRSRVDTLKFDLDMARAEAAYPAR
jgi:hypothetical protein